MTLVSGPLSTVTTTPSAVSQVNISINSPRTMGTGVITPEVKTVAVTGGDFSSQIAPGPAVLTLLIGGRESAPIPILVDDVESQTLADVVRAAGLADAGTLSQLEELALEVAADAAKVGTAAQVGEWAGQAAEARDQAVTAASSVEGMLMVVAHADNAYHPRPETVGRVMWLGTVVPFHRRAGDLVPEVVPIPAPWTPEMLDLVAWYDPANGYESGTVSQITDRGPRNLHMGIGGTGGISIDTSTLALPTFTNAGTAFATSPVLPAGAWEHPVTVYMVVSLSTLPTVSAFFDNGTGASSTRVAMWVVSDGRLGLNQGVSVNSAANTVSANTPFLVAATFSGDANTYAELNGSVVVGPADAGSNTLGSIRLFANGAGANIADAVIGDVIIARSVTPEQHADTVAWLQEKWGLV